MKRIAFAILILALLCAGCVDKNEDDSAGNADEKTVSNETGAGEDRLTTAISSPRPGDILTGNNDLDFIGDVKGGKEPYTYSWSSNIDGQLSSEKSFRQNPSELSKGEHNLIFKATDSSGRSAQSSVLIRVM